MAGEHRPWRRQREAFWRAHHEAWKLSEVNQREYCEAHRLPQKGFENWRQKFKAEPQVLGRKLLYRRGGLIPRLIHTLVITPNDATPRPIVPRRAGAVDGRSATMTSVGSSTRRCG